MLLAMSDFDEMMQVVHAHQCTHMLCMWRVDRVFGDQV